MAEPSTLTDAEFGRRLEQASRIADEGQLCAVIAELNGLLQDSEAQSDRARVRQLRQLLADAYHRIGENDTAVELQAQVEDDVRREVGDGHPAALEALGRLTEFASATERWQELLPMLESLKRVSEMSLGRDHETTVAVTVQLGDHHSRSGRYLDGLDQYEAALAALTRTLGAEHASTIAVRRKRDQAIELDRSSQDRINRIRRAIEHCESVYGVHSDEVQCAQSDLAESLALAGEKAEAISLREHLVEQTRTSLGLTHRKTLAARANLAVALWADRQFEAAIAIEERVLEDSRTAFGPDDEFTIHSMAELAASYETAGRLADAIDLGFATVEKAEAALGPQDLLTQRARRNLADVLRLREQRRSDDEPDSGHSDGAASSAPEAPGAQQGSSASSAFTWDVFVSYASEDRAQLVKPLAELLSDMGMSVWWDQLELSPGDSLTDTISAGLARSRFGIVVLSTHFFAKRWPQYELQELASREVSGTKVLLPIWFGMTSESLGAINPQLAGKKSINIPGAFERQDLVAACVAILEIVRPDLLTRVHSRVAWANAISAGEKWRLSPSGVRSPPAKHERLPNSLLTRIRLIRASLFVVYPHSMEFWVEGFRRDSHPAREIEQWERVACAFQEFVQFKASQMSEGSLSAHEDFYAAFLFFVNALFGNDPEQGPLPDHMESDRQLMARLLLSINPTVEIVIPGELDLFEQNPTRRAHTADLEDFTDALTEEQLSEIVDHYNSANDAAHGEVPPG